MKRLKQVFLCSGISILLMINPAFAAESGRALNQNVEGILGELIFQYPVKLVAILDASVVEDNVHIKNVDPDEGMAVTDAAGLIRQGQVPAALLLEYYPTGKDLHLLFYNQKGLPRKVLSLPISRRFSDGGGFTTLNDVRLIRDKSQSDFVVLSVTQTSIPGKNERPFMPGPPLVSEYRYDYETQKYDISVR